VTRAECYWAMATAHLGFSYAASQNIPELFTLMFPDSKVAADYAMKDRKLSYVMSHGTGHFFARELVKDVLKAPSYSLLFDETTIVGVRKQLDLHIRYWSELKQGVVTRYWKSIMLGHATADIIGRHLLDSLKSEGIPLCKLLHLGELNFLFMLKWPISLLIQVATIQMLIRRLRRWSTRKYDLNERQSEFFGN